jgi:hypothetical protein
MSAYLITIEDAGGSRMTTEVPLDEMAAAHDARDRLVDAAEILVTCFLKDTGVPFALRPGELVRSPDWKDWPE